MAKPAANLAVLVAMTEKSAGEAQLSFSGAGLPNACDSTTQRLPLCESP